LKGLQGTSAVGLESTKRIQSYDYIDALRGLAILGVMAIHCGQHINGMGVFLHKIVMAGDRGVQLFFVVSAFTLCHAISKRHMMSSHHLPSFYIRRLFRIAPLFYLAAIFYLMLYGLAPSYWAPEGIGWAEILTTAAFVHGWFPDSVNSVVPGGWSIADEMMFYLCLPLLLWGIKSFRGAVVVLIGSIFFSLFVLYIGRDITNMIFPGLPDYLVSSYVFFSFPVQLPAFIAGITVYKLSKEDMTGAISKYASRIFYASILSIFLIFPFARLLVPALPVYILYVIAFSLLLLSLQSYSPTIIVNRWMVGLGKISFSCYIIHFAVVAGVVATIKSIFPRALEYGELSFVIIYAVVIGVTAGIAKYTYHHIEKRGIHLGNQIICKLTPVPTFKFCSSVMP